MPADVCGDLAGRVPVAIGEHLWIAAERSRCRIRLLPDPVPPPRLRTSLSVPLRRTGCGRGSGHRGHGRRWCRAGGRARRRGNITAVCPRHAASACHAGRRASNRSRMSSALVGRSAPRSVAMTAGSRGRTVTGPPRVRLVGPGSRSAARTTAPRLPGWRGCRPVVPRTPSWSTRRMPSSSDVAMCRASGRRARPGSRRGRCGASGRRRAPGTSLERRGKSCGRRPRTGLQCGRRRGTGSRNTPTLDPYDMAPLVQTRDQSPQQTRTSRSRPASSSK